jgi:hypothetical protein
MTRENLKKLNHFMVTAPSGVVLTSEWLIEQGISPKLAWWYVHSGLLERLGMRAYKKAGDSIAWPGVVVALQNQMHIAVHVGAKTALHLLGRTHFVPLQGVKHITLITELETRMPTWLSKKISNADFMVIRTSLFKSKDKLLGIIDRPVNGITIRISCPERAILELIYLYPKLESITELALIFESLNQLRPDIVQQLLEQCNSIKVKRLFLYLAENFNHPWLSYLSVEKINLGEGKRVIGKGGKYNAKYKLSLPKLTEN